MASADTTTAPPGEVGDRQPLAAWLEKNRRAVGYGGAAVALAILGGWFLMESGKRKEAFAIDALDRARLAYETGNLPAASAELQRVIQSFRGTEAAHEAVLALNEVRLASGQPQLAADELRGYIQAKPPSRYAAGANFLLGTALENLARHDEAAQAYAASAADASEPYRKADAMLAQARALKLAGKAEPALQVLRTLVRTISDSTPGHAEARVRLAELTKGAM